MDLTILPRIDISKVQVVNTDPYIHTSVLRTEFHLPDQTIFFGCRDKTIIRCMTNPRYTSLLLVNQGLSNTKVP